ncbi:uncharacterized protein LOC131239487 [Magnolia sinica]|uniref:uncharacterized protein LOC131239487 n=1 Tax=Magnolia sinica TaxID=86752 RepID=UPI0026584D42|nr:uncharacterized protein LOC131239487 [Magnolia sinica]
MKNLYQKSKGKIHPSPSSSASSSSSSPLLNRLPPEIRSLVSTTLPPEDLEVLAYLIKTNQPSFKSCKKSHPFDCSCFHCYTTFWTRWDSSPNRNLIHQALEAFEESHLPTSPKPPKKRDRRVSADKSKKNSATAAKRDISELGVVKLHQSATSDDGPKMVATVSSGVSEVERVSEQESDISGASAVSDVSDVGVIFPQLPEASQQGLVRKVWPDVLGLFNSRLWNLWSPNV